LNYYQNKCTRFGRWYQGWDEDLILRGRVTTQTLHCHSIGRWMRNPLEVRTWSTTLSINVTALKRDDPLLRVGVGPEMLSLGGLITYYSISRNCQVYLTDWKVRRLRFFHRFDLLKKRAGQVAGSAVGTHPAATFRRSTFPRLGV
jgi:hypothetical protein